MQNELKKNTELTAYPMTFKDEIRKESYDLATNLVDSLKEPTQRLAHSAIERIHSWLRAKLSEML